MDNTVYEIFEADRTKYTLYEEAVFRAVGSLIKTHSLPCIRIAVVGAGRGGLIDACVHAIKRTQSVASVFFDIIGVEKSPHAALTLSYKAKDDELWHSLGARGSVSILHADMRGWTPDSPIDILVSELLGSLGDNEASPECLESVMHVLHPERGVSIPSRYNSTLEPVSSHRIWTSAREGNKFETPLVVYFHSCFKPSSPLELFSFAHSTGKCRNALNQSKLLSWDISQDTTVHGFAGYFHAELFEGVVMSINPPTATEQMVSWFPAFLPIRTPILVKAGERLSVRVDRVKTDVKVWIEWTVVSPHCQATNNACGSTHSVGL
jgi:protein arginine N-methyltransferase 5